MIPFRVILAFFLVVWLPISSKASNDTYFNVIEKLHVDLLTRYNKQIRPVLKHTDTLKVESTMRLTHFDFEDMNARFSARGFLLMTWKDPRFVWSPADYEGLKSVHIPSDIIWTPDLEVYRLDGKLSKDRTFASATNALVMSDGTVLYVPLTNFVSRCSPTLDRWPFDKHECKVKVGSWTYDTVKMSVLVENNATKLNLEDMDGEASPHWDLLDTGVDIVVKTYDCCPEPYSTMVYSFTFQRRSAAAKFTTVATTFVIVALTLATFFIPPMVGAKLVVGVVDLGLLCAYLIHFDTVLPSTGSAPWIVSFYGATLILVVVSLISSIATFSWTRLPKSHPPPACIMNLFTVCSFNRILGVDMLKAQTAEEQKLAEKKEPLIDTKSNSAQQQWICLSLALHRLMFGIYCIIFAVLVNCCLI